jgi:hypothetical protein
MFAAIHLTSLFIEDVDTTDDNAVFENDNNEVNATIDRIFLDINLPLMDWRKSK